MEIPAATQAGAGDRVRRCATSGSGCAAARRWGSPPCSLLPIPATRDATRPPRRLRRGGGLV